MTAIASRGVFQTPGNAGDSGPAGRLPSRRRPRILPAFVLAVLVALALAGPAAADAPLQGDIWVADPGFDTPNSVDFHMWRVDPATGARTLLADDIGEPYWHDVRGGMVHPCGLALEPDGDIVVGDQGQDPISTPGAAAGRVYRVNPVSRILTKLVWGLETDPYLADLCGVALEPDGDIVAVDADLDSFEGYVVRIDPATRQVTVVSRGGLLSPRDYRPALFPLEREADGDILVSNTQEGHLIRIDPVSGAQTLLVSGGFAGIAVEPDGQILLSGYRVDAGVSGVHRFDPASSELTTVSSGVWPSGIALEPDGDILVAAPEAGPCKIRFEGYGHTGAVIRVDPVSGAQTVVSAIAEDDPECVNNFGYGTFSGEMSDVAVCRPCPTSLPVSGGGSYGGTATLTATLDSGSPAWSTAGKRITFTLDGMSVGTAVTDAAGVAELTGVSLAGRNAGTYTSAVGARFAGDSGYRPSAASGDLTVARVAGSVRIANIPTGAVFGGSFTPTYTKAGDGAVVLESRTPSVCSVGFLAVSYDAAGTCTLQASVAEGTNHLAATGPEQSFTIAKAAGSVRIDNIPTDAFFKDSFTPSYLKAGDGLASTTSKTPGVCSVSAGVVSFHMVGTCSLQAQVAEGTNHLAALGPEQSFPVAGFTFTGFAAPINNGFVNGAKAGQAIPVKYRLTLPDGTPVSDPASFLRVSSQSGGGLCAGLPLDAIETYAGSSGLLYLGDGDWQFNWKTPKEYAGQCRTMTLTLEDGSTHTATFQFM